MKLKTIIATRTVAYTPERYLEHCEETGETPTRDGFYAYEEANILDDLDIGDGREWDQLRISELDTEQEIR